MNRNKLMLLLLAVGCFSIGLNAQSNDRWQQRVKYKMDVQMDVEKHQYTAHQELEYFNNSPDTLKKVYYHLFFNAFQPGSMMDVRSRTIMDPDQRVGDRISKLSPEEIGYQKINSLKSKGESLHFVVDGTILEVLLKSPILPGESVVFDMDYQAQVPLQIRRSGRDNKEDIDFSMTQWYPKMCEYDIHGWHMSPYIGREFYGIWGDYDVSITLPSNYIIGGTGVLVNADKIGYGYSDKEIKHAAGPLTWHFIADNVHDFAFAADPDYKHTSIVAKNGTTLHFLYQEGEETASWEQAPEIMVDALSYMNDRFGEYPYPVYTFIQGGDGGMEYPMITLLRGHRSLNSLVGVSIHEWMHSWYQMMLGTNESLFSWMDEGFTSYADTEVQEYLKRKKWLSAEPSANPWKGTYNAYTKYIQSPYAEPCSTHSDHYNTNYAYGMNSYVLGNIFMRQLEYIIGPDALTQGLLDYYNTWKFKHPNADDFVRIMERASDLHLDWYKEYWVNTTKTIDYGIDTLVSVDSATIITLNKIGLMPMPIDIEVELSNGQVLKYNIPLRIMRGNRPLTNGEILLEDWPWVNPTYQFTINENLEDITKITIDPSSRLADIKLENNVWPEVVVEEVIEESGHDH